MEPWRDRLSQGETTAAWDLFIERYRRLILASIRRMVFDDDVMEAFAHVCERLSADDLSCLRRYEDGRRRGARFSTWLTVVVRNQTVDWLRQRDGRRRLRAPPGLSPVQRWIFDMVFVDGRSHAEAYEVVNSLEPDGMRFGPFLRELAETYRAVERSRGRGAMRYFRPPEPPPPAPARSPEDSCVRSELAGLLDGALDAVPPDARLAVQLFVVEGLSAAEVANAVGWPDAKAVYNRVYRTLRAVRREFEERGLVLSDLVR